MHELRCDNKILFGIVEDRVLEVTCRSRRCGYERGVVVIHRFDLVTGDLLGTRKFRDPNTRKETKGHATRNESALRSA